MKSAIRSLALTAVFLILATTASLADTRVWLMYGLGDNFLWTSNGIDQIARQARQIPGVTVVYVRNYWETQRIADEVMATPAKSKIVIGGYSCGANSATVIARGLYGYRKINTVTGIQQSAWCGGYPLYSNVSYGQMTFAGCVQTYGLGCKRLRAGQGFNGRIRNIRRPARHGYADNDPDAQQDVLRAIRMTAQ
ncbi:MAG TPA: hypothetical protein VF753_09885 [Terriglobales bacterium]